MSQQSNNPHLVPWVVWGGLFASLGAYLLALVMTEGQTQAQDETGIHQTMLFAFIGVSLLLVAVVIPLARKFLFFRKLRNDEFDSLSALRGSYFTASILSWALSESIAIYGFMLSLLTGELTYYVGFAVPAAILFIVLHPRLKQHEQEWKESRPKASEEDEAQPSGSW